MSVFVMNLDNVRLADVPRAGSKDAVPGTLLAAGFPAPPALCITTAAFHEAPAPYADRIGKSHTPEEPQL